MSDFLTNVAARSLAAPALRPRTRSRFEPEPNASPWLSPPASSEVAVEREVVPVAPARRAVSHAPHPEMPIEPPPRETPRRAAVPAADQAASRRLVPQAAARDAAAPAGEDAGVPARVETRTLDHETRVFSHEAHTTHETERMVERVTDRVRETREPEIHVTHVEIPRDDKNAPPPEQPRHRHDEQPPRILRETRETRTHLLTRETPRQARVEAPVTPPEPVIHVSIGRVEVRATAPAAPAPRVRKHNAPMTLDDYAARRNAKGRP